MPVLPDSVPAGRLLPLVPLEPALTASAPPAGSVVPAAKVMTLS